jgi:hypothetical protein
MAIRLALGAAPGRIIGLVLTRLGLWLSAGLALGIAGGAIVSAHARGLLYETSPLARRSSARWPRTFEKDGYGWARRGYSTAGGI